MKKLILRIRNKLHTHRGESLTETLVALLIGALALMMLAQIMAAAGKIVTKGERYVSEFTTADNAVNASGSGTNGTVKFQIGGSGVNISDPNGSSGDISVKYIQNSKKSDVIRYE